MHRKAQELHALGLGERVHDRGRVHPQLHQEGEQDLEVAVLRGEGRDDGAETQRQAGDHDDQDRGEQDEPVQVRRAVRVEDHVEDIHQHEEPELDSQAQEIADDVRDGHHQAREIHLSEDARVLHERIGGLGDTVGEVLPQAGSGEVEQRARHAVRGDAGDAAEHDHVHDDRQGRLNHIPDRTQDRLLVLGDDIALDEQRAQVAVPPEFLEVNGKEAVLRFDDKVPVLFFFHRQCDLLCLNRMLPTVPQKYRQSVRKGCAR